MKATESDLDHEFIEFATGIGKTYGFDILSSKLFAILYLEPKEIAMEDLSNKTGYSMASVCNSIKVIEKTGFLNKIHKPGTKKLYFTLEKDFSKHMKAMVEMVRRSKIMPAKEILPGLIVKYKNAGFKEKHKTIENYYKHILKLEKITNYIEAQL